MKNIIKNSLILTIYFFIITTAFANEIKRFSSLKNNEVNLRLGPSFEHPIKLIYKKKFLPVLIIDASENWRQIMDFEKNTGWIHVSQLTKKKSAINNKNNSIIYEKPTIYSKPMVRLERGRQLIILKCKKNWCKTKTENFTGWIKKNHLWGKVN
tara:strand:- start:1784 stop:2245 length:462 start_codon:yes stop_codon:yes gene_type:complete